MPSKLIFPCLIAFIILRLVFWINTFPNPDEAYYWLWGQHLEWSYYDHPPLHAWIQGLFTSAFGRSNIVLRSPNLISNSVLFHTYYRITRYLYGHNARYHFWILVMLVLASPLYFLFLALAWHDHWLITFSLISAYQFIRFLDGYLTDGQGESWRLYGAAGAIALAGLCKYNAVFVVFGFVATVIADKRLRPLWRDRRIYLAWAILISALIPILLWNISNDFQSFHYYVNRSINTGSFSLKFSPFLNFVLFSFLMVSPINWISFFQGARLSTHTIFRKTVYLSVTFWVFLISTITLTIISLVSAALYYWNITAYLLLFPLATAFFLKNDRNSSSESLSSNTATSTTTLPFNSLTSRPSLVAHKYLFYSGQFLGLLFASLLVVHYSFFPLSALFSQTEDPDSRMLFGWREVGEVVKAEAAGLGENPLLITTDYRSASALAYQLDDKQVMAISDRIDQFDFWYTNAEAFKGRNAVILSDDWHPVQPELLSKFRQTSASITIPVKRFGMWIKTYYVLKGFQFKGNISQ